MPGPYAIEAGCAQRPAPVEAAGPHLHSGRCPSSRSAPTSACPRRSTRGIRAPGTSRATSPAWSRPRGPGRSRSTSAARRCPGCRARTSSTSASRPTPTTSRTITDALLSLGFQRQSGLAPVPADPAADARQRRPRRDVVPRPPPRHAAGAPRAAPSCSRSATRCAPTPRCATGTPRSKQEFVEAAPDGDANLLYTVHKGGFVLRTRCTASASARRPADAPEPLAARARRSGSWAAGSSAGCSGSRPARWATGWSPSTPTRTARPRRSPTEIVVGALRRRRRRAAAGRDGRRRDLRAGARRARRRGRGRRAARRCARGWRRSRRPATGSPSGGSSARSGSGPRRGARSVASTTRAAAAEALGYPLRLKVPIGGYDGRSQVRIDGRRPGSRPR